MTECEMTFNSQNIDIDSDSGECCQLDYSTRAWGRMSPRTGPLPWPRSRTRGKGTSVDELDQGAGQKAGVFAPFVDHFSALLRDVGALG